MLIQKRHKNKITIYITVLLYYYILYYITILLCIYIYLYSRTNVLKNNEKQVVAIPNDLPLCDNERSVLNKGLKFIPLEKTFHCSTTCGSIL